MPPIENLFSYGNKLEKMLISCFYDQKPCDLVNDFKPIISPMYGQCFAFNWQNKYKLKRPGNRNGLILELFLGDTEFTPCWINSRGGLVVIKSTNQTPLFIEEGHIFQTGTETSYQLSQKDYVKLPKPYGNCSENMIESQKTCLTFCADRRNLVLNEVSCNASNDSTSACLNNSTLIADFYSECSIECPPECKLSVYDISIDHASYPALNYAKNVLMQSEKFMSKFSFVNGSSVTFDRVKDSTAMLNIHFGTNCVQKYSEVPETDFLAL